MISVTYNGFTFIAKSDTLLIHQFLYISQLYAAHQLNITLYLILLILKSSESNQFTQKVEL
ncbi:hypothetical protein HOG21_03110 [bacterium]|nr:hypothetical protein [bacterium]